MVDKKTDRFGEWELHPQKSGAVVEILPSAKKAADYITQLAPGVTVEPKPVKDKVDEIIDILKAKAVITDTEATDLKEKKK